MESFLSPVYEEIARARKSAGLSAEDLDRELVLGPGWIEGIEAGLIVPDLGLFATLCQRLNIHPGETLGRLPQGISPLSVSRTIRATPLKSGLQIDFQYAEHLANYELKDARIGEFEEVLLELRDGLADSRTQKADAVMRSYQKAVGFWKSANPSDIWWFILYRAFTDPFNHPAARYGGDHAQSWIRTSGWALERIFVEHYANFLKANGIGISIENAEQKRILLGKLRTKTPLNVDKADVILTGTDSRGNQQCFGVVHVKASFAERRTDDEPMSRSLSEAGYCSPLLTMDCKSIPSAAPVNKGELGSAYGHRGDKRKDIEVNGIFTGCFSFNARTEPTVDRSAKSRIDICNFSTADDAFTRHVIDSWDRFKE